VVDGVPIIGRPTKGFGDVDFAYAGKDLVSEPWESNETVNDIRLKLESMLGCKFAHCLAGLYEDETVSIPFHRDEIQGVGDLIVSVSLGATRDFLVRVNETQRVNKIILVHGDVVVMDYDSQQESEHCVPLGVMQGPRINLTYRTKNGEK
jgi:alkylated DNA repair dioxygenase AlkB